MGVLAGLAEMCALGTTQALRGACSSLMAGPNLMLLGRAELRVLCVLSLALPSARWAGLGLFIARGEAAAAPPVPGLGRKVAWSQPQAAASGMSPCRGSEGPSSLQGRPGPPSKGSHSSAEPVGAAGRAARFKVTRLAAVIPGSSGFGISG